MSLLRLVRHLVEGLVDRPEDVDVREVEGSHPLVLELRVHRSDLGKIIGRKGQTARAVRTVVAAAAARQRQRVHVNIVEE